MKHNYLPVRRRHYFRPRCRAFNRIELLAVCACLGVLSLLVAPTLASNKTDSERLICFNNLRLIGRGVQMFAGDHNQPLAPSGKERLHEFGPGGEFRRERSCSKIA